MHYAASCHGTKPVSLHELINLLTVSAVLGRVCMQTDFVTEELTECLQQQSDFQKLI